MIHKLFCPDPFSSGIPLQILAKIPVEWLAKFVPANKQWQRMTVG